MNTHLGGHGYKGKVSVLGGNGFIGHHLARRLKADNYYVLVVDIKHCEYSHDHAHDFIIGDLRDPNIAKKATSAIDFVYQLAADMGGCQYVFTGEHDADILSNSALININVATWAQINKVKRVFYSSSACMYPQEAQTKSNHPGLKETDAYPANPDSNYGWEKLFSERLWQAYADNYNMEVRIARYHNIYGPEGTWKGGKEKAPASISRKVAEAKNRVEIWGEGMQTRSFLYIDDCIDATIALMNSDYKYPVNIGSEESVSIKELWKIAVDVSGKNLEINHIPRPKNVLGVMGRNSDNTLIEKELAWKPKFSLREGMEKTFNWIQSQYDGNI